MSIEFVALISLWTGRDSSPIWRNVFSSWLRGKIGKISSPYRSQNPLGELGVYWKDWLEVTKVLKSVTVSSPVSWIFIITGTRRFCLGDFICWGYQEFLQYSFKVTHLECESWFARLTKSAVGMVSHSILVLITRRERSRFNLLINRIKRYLDGINTWRKTRIFFINILTWIIKIVKRFCRILSVSLNFVPISRLWESPRICSVKLPRDNWSLII